MGSGGRVENRCRAGGWRLLREPEGGGVGLTIDLLRGAHSQANFLRTGTVVRFGSMGICLNIIIR